MSCILIRQISGFNKLHVVSTIVNNFNLLKRQRFREFTENYYVVGRKKILCALYKLIWG